MIMANTKAAPKKIKSEQGSVQVTRTIVNRKNKTEDTHERNEKITIRPFATDTGTVGAKKGVTLNAGDYQSLRVDVVVMLPCYREEAVLVYEQASALADELLAEEINEIPKFLED
jgi:hypothetical protein